MAEAGSINKEKILITVTRDDELVDAESASIQSFLRTNRGMNRRKEAENHAKQEWRGTEDLSLSILPRSIDKEMKDGEPTIARTHPSASVLFADMVGFTAFDDHSDQHRVEKIKTIADLD